MFREYKPAGFDTWLQYYEAERVKCANVNKVAEIKESLFTASYIIGIIGFSFGMLWVGCFLDFIYQH